jgi:hypothetical protein
MKPLIIYSGANGNPSFAIDGSDTIHARHMTTSAETHTVPAGANFVVFSANQDFYVRWNGTAAIPVADVTDGTGSELNPTVRRVVAGKTFSIIGSAASTVVTMAFYS